jgi:hypothetical protein
MDYELAFWCLIGFVCLFFLIGAALTPPDISVSEDTLRHLRGERTH